MSSILLMPWSSIDDITTAKSSYIYYLTILTFSRDVPNYVFGLLFIYKSRSRTLTSVAHFHVLPSFSCLGIESIKMKVNHENEAKHVIGDRT